MAHKLNTLVIEGDRCGNCGRYFGMWAYGPTKSAVVLRHMCPPRTKKLPISFLDEYKHMYLEYLLETDEFRLMWGFPKKNKP